MSRPWRVKLWWRTAMVAVWWVRVVWPLRMKVGFCRFQAGPVREFMVGLSMLGFVNLDALEIENVGRRWEAVAKMGDLALQEELFMGTDSDHPDGIYARGPQDMVCMDCDEYEAWFGERKNVSLVIDVRFGGDDG